MPAYIWYRFLSIIGNCQLISFGLLLLAHSVLQTNRPDLSSPERLPDFRMVVDVQDEPALDSLQYLGHVPVIRQFQVVRVERFYCSRAERNKKRPGIVITSDKIIVGQVSDGDPRYAPGDFEAFALETIVIFYTNLELFPHKLRKINNIDVPDILRRQL